VEVKPNFLIVGAARSGTTSLCYWLKQHPEVFMPDNKEPSYFVNGYGVSNWDIYVSLFKAGEGKRAIGEASTAYLSAPEAPKWIRKMLGQVRIIILLRNPVERALSLYAWMVMEGYEWLPTLESAVAEEDKRYADEQFRRTCPEWFWDYMYFRSGLYCEQVERYISVFGRDLVRIYLFEDLVSSPGKVYSELCEFLGISDTFRPVFSPQNPSRIPRFIKLQYLARTAMSVQNRNLRKLAALIAPLIMSLNTRLGHKAVMSPLFRRKLLDMYRSDITNLADLIRRDLSEWLS
jgi:hypothetical protein